MFVCTNLLDGGSVVVIQLRMEVEASVVFQNMWVEEDKRRHSTKSKGATGHFKHNEVNDRTNIQTDSGTIQKICSLMKNAI